MLKLIIEDDEGRKTVVPFVREEITIGRQEGNTIRLTERNVSRRHARLLRHNGAVMVEDLGSYNGIKINGEKISGQVSVRDGDLIQIGDYDLAIQSDATVAAAPPPAPVPSGEHPVASAPPTLLDTAVPPPLPEPPRAAPIPPVPPTLPAIQAVPETSPRAEVTPPPPVAAAAPAAEAAKRHATALLRREESEPEPEIEEADAVEDIDPAAAPRLVVLNTQLAGREFALLRTDLRLGRTDENDISVDHRSLSRVHARLHRDGSGAWRIEDLQSSNGINVNGESYAQSPLSDGDVIELGHVRFRFVGAGKTFRFVPGPEKEAEIPAPKRSKAPVLILTAVLIGGGAAAVMYALPNFGSKLQLPANETVAAPEVKKGTPVPSTTPPSGSDQQSAKLRAARDALALKKFEKAKDVLESLRASSALTKEGQALLAQAETEIAAKQNLPSADKLLAANKLDEAEALIEQSKSTVAFAGQFHALSARLESARAKERKLLARRSPTPEKTPAGNDRAPEKPVGKNVERFADEGSALIKRGLPDKAVAVLRRCIDANPLYPRCHKLLGSAYGSLHDGEKGALHYRRFLELAPNDDSAATVRQILEAYEANKRAQTSN